MQTPSEKFHYLCRDRDNALSLFAKVLRRLEKIEAKIRELICSTEGEIEEAKKQIEDHKEAMAYLENQLKETEKSKEKISSLIS